MPTICMPSSGSEPPLCTVSDFDDVQLSSDPGPRCGPSIGSAPTMLVCFSHLPVLFTTCMLTVIGTGARLPGPSAASGSVATTAAPVACATPALGTTLSSGSANCTSGPAVGGSSDLLSFL